jgi:hypothetical protein
MLEEIQKNKNKKIPEKSTSSNNGFLFFFPVNVSSYRMRILGCCENQRADYAMVFDFVIVPDIHPTGRNAEYDCHVVITYGHQSLSELTGSIVGNDPEVRTSRNVM